MLCRIPPTVEEYLSHSQSIYRQGRGTSDIVWCHRFLDAPVLKFQKEIMITGIDMTSVFDTIKRTKFIEILESFLREEEIRVIRIVLGLVISVMLVIAISSNISNPFDANIGLP